MTTRIIESLTSQFASQRFVFWHDAESAFAAEVAALSLPGITIVMLDKVPALELKQAIEHADAASLWLFYSNLPEPKHEHDWLLDVRMRSKPFYADATSILLADLGLHSLALRDHLKQRAKFLAAKERVIRLKKLVQADDTEFDLDRKMIALSVRAEQADFANILLKLLTGLEQSGEGEVDLAPPPRAGAR
ncbi:hypothetical protein [Chromobacterium subtsugae]|uniref:hypothetical protein n=1 Tax=Chromobacterium subtsugae TaxID=251747 RepID=UPI000A52CD9B|nr:hypothetical protein [Chromobacterium subtsugae]